MNNEHSHNIDLSEYLPMVRRMAWSVAHRVPGFISVDDLNSEGLMALVEASQQYDDKRGAAFFTFAFLRVRGKMLQHVHRECRHASLIRRAPVSPLAPQLSPPEHQAAVRETVERMLEGISNLPWRRRALMEGLADDHDLKDVAAELELSMSNAYKLKRLAREQLRAASRVRRRAFGRLEREFQAA